MASCCDPGNEGACRDWLACLEVVESEDVFVFPVERERAVWSKEYSGLVSSRLTGLLGGLYTLVKETGFLPSVWDNLTGGELLT